MIANYETDEAHYDDGQLSYRATLAYLVPGTEGQYPRGALVFTPPGRYFIRVGTAIKLRRDGTEMWRIDYGPDGLPLSK